MGPGQTLIILAQMVLKKDHLKTMRHPMVYFRNAMLKILVQIMCHTHRNNFKYVAHQYTMYSSTMCSHEVILSRSEPRERTQPTSCGWHLQLEGFPNLSRDEI